jgi:hypothetical protein
MKSQPALSAFIGIKEDVILLSAKGDLAALLSDSPEDMRKFKDTRTVFVLKESWICFFFFFFFFRDCHQFAMS